MVRRSSGRLGIDPDKPELRKIKFIDEDINHPNWIVLVDPVLQAFRKQRRLTAIYPINEALHPIPANHRGIIALRRTFSHSQGQQLTWLWLERLPSVRCSLASSLRIPEVIHEARKVAILDWKDPS